MPMAETAKLIALLELQDKLTPGMASALNSVAKLEGKMTTAQTTTDNLSGHMGRAGSGMSLLQRATTGAGGAFDHLKGQVGNLLGAAGIAGLAGGALTVAGALEQSITKSVALADASRNLAGITHESTSAMSGLSAGLSHFGIEADTQIKLVGFLEKNMGLLAVSSKKVDAFQKEFGFSITDSSGKVKDAQQVITDFTDYYNNDAIPASEKAALASKLFGRSWTELIPVLSAGKGALAGAIDEAAQFGETLSSQDVTNLNAMRDAMRTWHTALSGLETQIGLVIVPEITKLANAANDFLRDPNNRASLIGFFKQGVQFAEDFAGYLKNDVFPVVRNLAGLAKSFWDSIPGPLRDLLTQGLVADKTVKFLFGIDPLSIGKNVIGDAIGTAIGRLFSRGSSPAAPMYVKDIQAEVTEEEIAAKSGLGGGGGGGVGGGFFGGSRLVQAVSIVSIAADVLAVFTQFQAFLAQRDSAQADLQQKADATAQQTATEALANLKNLNSTLGNQGMWDSLVTNTFAAAQTQTGIENLGKAIADNGQLTSSQITDAIGTLQQAQQVALAHGWTDAATAIGADIGSLKDRLSSDITSLPGQLKAPPSATPLQPGLSQYTGPIGPLPGGGNLPGQLRTPGFYTGMAGAPQQINSVPNALNTVATAVGGLAGAVQKATTAVTADVSKMEAAFKGSTGSSGNAWKEFEKTLGGTSVPGRIKTLQGELDKFNNFMHSPKFLSMGPESTASFLQYRQSVVDELGKLQTFMGQKGPILASILPTSVADSQGDWKQQWADMLGITVDDLNAMLTAATTTGGKVPGAVAGGIKSSAGVVTPAVNGVVTKVTSPLSNLEQFGWSTGFLIAQNLGAGITAGSKQYTIPAANNLARAVQKIVKVASPAKEGPWSEDGGPIEWMHRLGMRMTAALAESLTAGTPVLAAAAAGVSHAATPRAGLLGTYGATHASAIALQHAARPLVHNEISVPLTVQVTGRTVATSVERYWNISRPRAV